MPLLTLQVNSRAQLNAVNAVMVQNDSEDEDIHKFFQLQGHKFRSYPEKN